MKINVNTNKNSIQIAGDHWTKYDQVVVAVRRWHSFDKIHRHVNQLVCGEPISGKGKGLLRKLIQEVKPNKIGTELVETCPGGYWTPSQK
jgi:hypothetical protein